MFLEAIGSIHVYSIKHIDNPDASSMNKTAKTTDYPSTSKITLTSGRVLDNLHSLIKLHCQVIFCPLSCLQTNLKEKRLYLVKGSIHPLRGPRAQRSTEGSLHLSVPEAVDEGVQHWAEEAVEQGQYFLLLLPLSGVRDHTHHHGDAKEESDHAEVGGAGGESLYSALL